MRRLVPALMLLAVALAAGCTNRGTSFAEQLGGLARQAFGGGEAEPPRQLTRAELDRIPYATIAVSFEGGPRGYLVPLADNGGYLDYRDAGGRGVVMLGNAVVRTLGLGSDLDAVRYDAADPIAHPRPVAEWRGGVWREYQFRLRDGPPYSVVLYCRWQRAARETIEIVELAFDLVRVVETCANNRREVVNTYWVEEETGFAWKSEQWVGPDQPPMTVEVIRPYAG